MEHSSNDTRSSVKSSSIVVRIESSVWWLISLVVHFRFIFLLMLVPLDCANSESLSPNIFLSCSCTASYVSSVTVTQLMFPVYAVNLQILSVSKLICQGTLQNHISLFYLTNAGIHFHSSWYLPFQSYGIFKGIVSLIDHLQFFTLWINIVYSKLWLCSLRYSLPRFPWYQDSKSFHKLSLQGLKMLQILVFRQISQ